MARNFRYDLPEQQYGHHRCTYILPSNDSKDPRLPKHIREATHHCWCSSWQKLADGSWRVWRGRRWGKPKRGEIHRAPLNDNVVLSREAAARAYNRISEELRALQVPGSNHISRADNNACFELSYYLQAVAKRIRASYPSNDYKTPYDR